MQVRVPSVEQEAARDLVRAREDVRGDLMRSRHRLSKLPLRQGILYSGGHPWTGVHEVWLRGQRFALPGLQLAFDTALETVLLTMARRNRLDAAISEMAFNSEYTPVVRRLCCLRWVSTLTGFGLAVEIGDWHRFTGSTIGAYLGLVPTEFSSGGHRSQGSITKTGNTHARRLLVESAWHHRKAYRPRPDHAGPGGPTQRHDERKQGRSSSKRLGGLPTRSRSCRVSTRCRRARSGCAARGALAHCPAWSSTTHADPVPPVIDRALPLGVSTTKRLVNDNPRSAPSSELTNPIDIAVWAYRGSSPACISVRTQRRRDGRSDSVPPPSDQG